VRHAAEILFLLCIVGYGLTTILYVAAWTMRRRAAVQGAFYGLLAVVGAHLSVAVLHTIAAGRLPLGPPPGASTVGPWDHPFSSLALLLGVAVCAAGLARPATRILGSFINPVIAGLVLGALLVGAPEDTAALLPVAFASAWVPLHTMSIYASVGLFALAFGSGILYLRQDRRLRRKQLPEPGGVGLPSLGVLDSINQWGFTGGLFGLTVGIVTGTFVAATGGLDGVDLRPKIVATLGLWMLYALGWQARYFFGWGGRRAAWFAIVGFVGLIASAVGIGHA
jgi:ABC-type transport system involved in cytochrome c biogenesis permease subunit